MSPAEELRPGDIPPIVVQAGGRPGGDGAASPAGAVADFGGTYKEAKDAFERAFLKAQLDKHHWNVSKTAEVIKLERSNLHKKIKQYRLESG